MSKREEISPFLEREHCDLYLDNEAVWLQSKARFGSFHPDFTPQYRENIDRAIRMIGGYSVADTVARMKPGTAEFMDIDQMQARDVYDTEGIITTNPNVLLNANPSDCGELAVYGRSNDDGRLVFALLHASKKTVADETYIKALDYMATHHQISPDAMSVIMSASARAASYKFPDVYDFQKESPVWQEYVYQDDEGNWHVDLHTKTVDDVVRFGIQPEALVIHPADTISDVSYQSHFRSSRLNEKRDGTNGVLFGARS